MPSPFSAVRVDSHLREESSSEQMEVPDLYSAEALFFCHALALLGENLSRQRHIGHIEAGMKCEEAVGDFRIEAGDEPCDSSYFCLIDIAGYQKRAGNEEGRHRSHLGSFSYLGEILQGPLIGDSSQRLVKVFIPSFQIEFDAAPQFQGQIHCLLEEFARHGAIRLPA
jgi:hypothetical protein